MQFKSVYEKWSYKRLTQEEAAVILGVSDRTFRRHCRRYESEGLRGLYDTRLERASHNSAPVDEVMSMLALFRTRYSNFNVAHFYEKYRDEHGGTRSYTWVKNQLQTHGIVPISKKRGAHRRKRERSAMVGMMLHQDASTHDWVAGKQWDLVVTMDDASSEI